jgi:hypothetical protein
MAKAIQPEIVIVYKLRDAKTGLFSGGGTYPRWSSNGKTWSSKGALKNHLRMKYDKVSKIPENIEVCECVTKVGAFFPATKLWDEGQD